MSLSLFTVEEENLVCVFDISNHHALINSISDVLPELEEPELCDITKSALRKLQALTDTEFDALTFHPTYYGDDEDDVAFSEV